MNSQRLRTNTEALTERLPADSTLVLRRAGWQEYESLLEAVGEEAGLRISFDRGILHIMTTSAECESYTQFIENLVRLCALRLGLTLRCFGSATIKKQRQQKGSEPDCRSYAQSALLIGQRKQIGHGV